MERTEQVGQPGRRGAQVDGRLVPIYCLNDEDAFDLLGAAESLVRRWKVVLAVMLAALGASAWIWFAGAPRSVQYKARVQLLPVFSTPWNRMDWAMIPPAWTRTVKTPLPMYALFFKPPVTAVFHETKSTLEVSAVDGGAERARTLLAEGVDKGLRGIVEFHLRFLKDQIALVKARLEVGKKIVEAAEKRPVGPEVHWALLKDRMNLAELETRSAFLKDQLAAESITWPLATLAPIQVTPTPDNRAAQVAGILILAVLAACLAVTTHSALAKRKAARAVRLT